MAPAIKPPQNAPFFSYTPKSLLEEAEKLISASAKVWDHVALITPSAATFADTIQPLIDDENTHLATSRVLYFISTVSPDADLRTASKQADVRLKQDVIERGSRPDVFAVVDAVARRPDVSDLPAEAQVYLRKLRNEFVRNGLGLDDAADRARLKQINLRLAELRSQFTTNLNADVSGIWLSSAELEGLTPAVLERYKQRDDKGTCYYFVNFKRPNVNAILSEVRSAVTRRKYYVAWDNRLKDSNGPLLLETLRLRRESAALLGFRNFSEANDSERMLSTARVAEFLDRLELPLQQLAQKELDELSKIKAAEISTLSMEQKDESSTKDIFRWDTHYYKRLAKLKSADIDTSKVAEYFAFQQIMPKFIDMYSLLFGLRFVALSPKEDGIDTWHEDVQVYAVWNADKDGGEFVGYLYIDPYPRDGKYGHVGTFCINLGYLKPDGTRQYPSAALVTNYPPPTASRPSLLKFPDVVNCFHELGHSVHNLVSRCAYSRFHGGQVPRDFVEIPCRLLEEFFWDANVIRAVSRHYADGTQLPEDLIRKTIETRFEGAALTKLSDFTFAKFDQAVHTTWVATEDNEHELSILFNKNRRDYSLLHSSEDLGLGSDAMHGQTHFRHINGYAASYYSYSVADAYSADMFEAKFRPLLTTKKCDGLADIVNDELRAEGRRFRRVILEPGSSNGSVADMITAYLGRDPDPQTCVNRLAAAATDGHQDIAT